MTISVWKKCTIEAETLRIFRNSRNSFSISLSLIIKKLENKLSSFEQINEQQGFVNRKLNIIPEKAEEKVWLDILKKKLFWAQTK